MKYLSYLNKYLGKYKYHLLLGTIFIIISNVFAILPAQVVRYSFDLVRENIQMYHLFSGTQLQEDFYGFFATGIFLYGGIILIMAILRGVFLFLMRQTIIVMSRLIEFDLKNEIYEHYQTLPLSFYRKNNTGDLMARISEDVSRVRMYIGPAIMYAINLMSLFIMVIPIMFIINPTLSIYSLLPLPLLSLSIYYVNNIINQKSEEIQKSLSGLSTSVQEAFSGIRVLKSFVREDESARNFEGESNNYRDKSLSLNMVNALFMPLIMGLIGLSVILTVYVGGLEVAKGAITTGIIAEFIIYMNMLTWPVTSVGWVTSIVQRAAASQKRINEFLETHTDIVSTKNLEKSINGSIHFNNVSFVYPDSGIKALENISFEVEPGQSLAIIGTTGSGKSTIANLMCRLYDTSQGSISIDGIDIKEYSLSSLRGQTGYVPQDVFLFSDTIRNNIAFGSKEIAKEEVLQAAREADVYDNIMAFPQGFETRLGERGITLSGGQKQRVSIARAIVRNPKILILDDCLSAVDTKTENTILNALKRIMKERTSVIISHRVSSAKLADKIIVLDGGQLVESGTHEQLMERNGIYRELYEKQLNTEEVDGSVSA
ncbi:ABC transporter ATP-binding protein [Cytophagales bacterium LB-30]|uniref:ABC transporter ATP-binding protein n=1 Tax=Shiella aurantiaca TaxID=3058365 RepID=A0ABT8F685_9BACT|nr:ABC transporter ATP-binding protein [Shiella aurantiaca]MDN4165976.1 ABC transporter ATP-binding protein [Shiella aurantiaca]